MNRYEIKQVIESLARSQGIYQRLLQRINEFDNDEAEKFWRFMESKEFKDSLDFVMWMEG